MCNEVVNDAHYRCSSVKAVCALAPIFQDARTYKLGSLSCARLKCLQVVYDSALARPELPIIFGFPRLCGRILNIGDRGQHARESNPHLLIEQRLEFPTPRLIQPEVDGQRPLTRGLFIRRRHEIFRSLVNGLWICHTCYDGKRRLVSSAPPRYDRRLFSNCCVSAAARGNHPSRAHPQISNRSASVLHDLPAGRRPAG